MVSNVCVSHSNIDMNKFSLMKPWWKVAIKSPTLRGRFDCFTKKKKTFGKNASSCLLSPASCILSPASCLLPPMSCPLSPASCLLPPISCIPSPASHLLPPISCLLLSEGGQAAEGRVMRRVTCAWHGVRVCRLCVHVRVVGGGRQRPGGSAREDEKRGFWLAARHLVPNSVKYNRFSVDVTGCGTFKIRACLVRNQHFR